MTILRIFSPSPSLGLPSASAATATPFLFTRDPSRAPRGDGLLHHHPAHRRIPLIIPRILRDTCDRGGRAPCRPAPAPLPTVAWTRFHSYWYRGAVLYRIQYEYQPTTYYHDSTTHSLPSRNPKHRRGPAATACRAISNQLASSKG
eukprot:scaffold12600_cov107-Isochrysis_galbana.AAC.2